MLDQKRKWTYGKYMTWADIATKQKSGVCMYFCLGLSSPGSLPIYTSSHTTYRAQIQMHDIIVFEPKINHSNHESKTKYIKFEIQIMIAFFTNQRSNRAWNWKVLPMVQIHWTKISKEKGTTKRRKNDDDNNSEIYYF